MDKQTFLSSYEKDGYQVIDSFIYDDIKIFLERNKPRKNHIWENSGPIRYLSHNSGYRY